MKKNHQHDHNHIMTENNNLLLFQSASLNRRSESFRTLSEDDFLFSFRYENQEKEDNTPEIKVSDHVNLNDLKLKSMNLWKVVITRDDILKSKKALESPNFSIKLSSPQSSQTSTSSHLKKESAKTITKSAPALPVVVTSKPTKQAKTVTQNECKPSASTATIKPTGIKPNQPKLMNNRIMNLKQYAKLKQQHQALAAAPTEKNTPSPMIPLPTSQSTTTKSPQTSESILSLNEYGFYNPDTFDFKLDENVLHMLYKLDGDKLKWFNFTIVDDVYYLNKTYHTRIDETVLIEKFKPKNENQKTFNISDLKKDQIVWSLWRNKGNNVWWPSRVIKVVPQRKSCKFHVFIKHYEMAQRWGNLLKTDTTQIEPFFWSIENHYNYKLLATEFKPQRYEFFTAYSNALIDFEEQSRQAETSCSNKSDENSSPEPKKYLIHGRLMSELEIKRLAYREPSRNLNKVLSERSAYSQSLINLLVSNECKQFIISILTKRVKNKRHKKYLKSDTYARENHLKCDSPGPLSKEHQSELKFFLNDLSRQYFQNKPANMSEYENDVLYPEALIWAIKKLDNLSDLKAERKFKQGFQLLEEEVLKEKCAAFLSDHEKNEINENNKLISAILEDFKLEDYAFELDPIDLIEPSLHEAVPEPITNFIEKLDENDSLFGSDADSLLGDDLDAEELEQVEPIIDSLIEQSQLDHEKQQYVNNNQQLIIIPLEASETVFTEQNIHSVESGYDVTSPDNFDTIGAIIESLMLSPKDGEKFYQNNCVNLANNNNSCVSVSAPIHISPLPTSTIENNLEENCYFFEYDIVDQQEILNENNVC